MKLRKRHKEGAEVSTESLNDIMFFLLLFFLIVSTLVNPNVIKLMLPNSKSKSSVAKQPISVSITADNQLFINKKPSSIDLLETMLQLEVNKNENPTVVLRCEKDLPVQSLVDVLQIGDKLKVKMVLATKTEK